MPACAVLPETKDMIISTLRELADLHAGSKHPIASLSTQLSPDALETLFTFLNFFGILEVTGPDLIIPANSARLFMLSVAEFLQDSAALIPTWTDTAAVADSINAANALCNQNFLHLMEARRKEVEGDGLRPIKQEKLVRAIIKHKFNNKDYVLMQYDQKVGQYQLIGGIVQKSDQTLQQAMKRKIREELSEINDAYGLIQVYGLTTDSMEDQIFFSNKFNVHAKYETHLFNVQQVKISAKEFQKEISGKNTSNKWFSMKDIEQSMTGKNKKKIFPIKSKMFDAIKSTSDSFVKSTIDIGMIATSAKVTAILALIAFVTFILDLFRPIFAFFMQLFPHG